MHDFENICEILQALHSQSYFEQARDKLKAAQRLSGGRNMSVNNELVALDR